MKTTLLFASLIALNLVWANNASAQNGPAIRVTNNGTPAIYRHASTLEEGFYRGLADLGRAVGDYNYNTSLAMINLQEAQRRSIENRKARIEAYYEVKRMNREWKAYNRRVVTREQAETLSKARQPRPLAERQYDSGTGRLFWPVALTNGEFSGYRDRIDRMAESGGVKTIQVRREAAAMKGLLKRNVKSMDAMDYIVAKRFLDRLEAEAVHVR